MAQYSIEDLRTDAERLGLRHQAGPVDDRAIERVDLVAVDGLSSTAAGTLVIITGDEQPPPFRIDVALRQASARGLAGVVFASDLALPETAAVLAGRAGVPVFAAPGTKAADLAKAIDRAIAGGASEAMMRGALAVERATATAASDGTIDAILAAASAALGIEVALVEDPSVSWSQSDAVCIGEVPIGRVVASSPDAATGVAVPVIASLLSRAVQRSTRDRYASTQSRADLLIELVLAESSRVEGFVGQAARLGLPLQQSHVAAWLAPTSAADPQARAPRTVQPALELFALQLVEARDEMWHLAFLQDDLISCAPRSTGQPTTNAGCVRSPCASRSRRSCSVGPAGRTPLVSAHRSWARSVCVSPPQRRGSLLSRPSPRGALAGWSSPTSRDCAVCCWTCTPPRSAGICCTTSCIR